MSGILDCRDPIVDRDHNKQLRTRVTTFGGMTSAGRHFSNLTLASCVNFRPLHCRYITVVRNAFAGTPTLLQENYTEEQLKESCATSDLL